MLRPLIFFLVFLIQLVAFGQSPLNIESGFQKQVLSTELAYFVDSAQSASIENIEQFNFLPNEVMRPNFGFVQGALWIKTTVNNNSDNSQFVFQINQPQLDSVWVYFVDQNKNIVKQSLLGESVPVSSREVKDRYLIVPFEIPQGEKLEIYAKVKSLEPIEVPLYICSADGSYEMMRLSDLILSAYFGLIMVMAFYNLFIYFSVRDKSYLLYVFYILFVGLTQAVLEGFTFLYLWPNSPWLAAHSVYISTSLVSVFSIFFLNDFLRTKLYAPKMYRYSFFIIGCFVVLIVASLFGIGRFIHISAQIGIGLVSLFIFATSVMVYRRGYTPAKFFLLAWIVLLVGIIVYSLKDAGLIPSTPLTTYLLQIGSAIEVILLSFALADRINILKREKAASQAQALRVSQENEKIVREQNIVLEDKVQERTQDLETSNTQLSSTLNELRATQSQLVNAEKMASLGLLTAGVAHEINNPINFVSANISPLRYDIDDLIQIISMYDEINGTENFEENKTKIESFKKEIDLDYVKTEINQLLDGIQDGASRTAEIVKGLKNFSRIDEDSLKPINLNEGIESTLILLKNEIPDHTEIVKDLGEIPLVECMGGKINQVFMNTMSNALQALEEVEKRKLTIKTWTEGADVYIEVSDTGKGMSPEIKAHIFEPFYTTKEVGKGTGLGLSISFNIIETHRGEIFVDSTPNEGSKFTIKLPIKSQIIEE